MASANDRVHKYLQHLVSVRSLISTKSLTKEAELLSNKWFDYRFIDPYDATVLFAKIYIREYKSVFAANYDTEKAKNVHGLRLKKVFSSRQETTQLWLARQRADLTGMPYDVYIQLSLKFALQRQRRKIPRPNQLHHSNCTDLWNDYRIRNWHAHLAGMNRDATHPAYQVENYRGDKSQDEYRKLILDRASGSSRKLSSFMERYCDDLGQMELESFRAICTPECYERALGELEFERGIVGIARSPAPRISLVDVWPSCFGLSPIGADDADTCSSCKVATSCGHMEGLATKRLVQTAGSATPVSDHVRELARERQRRCRASKRVPPDHAAGSSSMA